VRQRVKRDLRDRQTVVLHHVRRLPVDQKAVRPVKATDHQSVHVRGVPPQGGDAGGSALDAAKAPASSDVDVVYNFVFAAGDKEVFADPLDCRRVLSMLGYRRNALTAPGVEQPNALVGAARRQQRAGVVPGHFFSVVAVVPFERVLEGKSTGVEDKDILARHRELSTCRRERHVEQPLLGGSLTHFVERPVGVQLDLAVHVARQQPASFAVPTHFLNRGVRPGKDQFKLEARVVPSELPVLRSRQHVLVLRAKAHVVHRGMNFVHECSMLVNREDGPRVQGAVRGGRAQVAVWVSLQVLVHPFELVWQAVKAALNHVHEAVVHLDATVLRFDSAHRGRALKFTSSNDLYFFETLLVPTRL